MYRDSGMLSRYNIQWMSDDKFWLCAISFVRFSFVFSLAKWPLVRVQYPLVRSTSWVSGSLKWRHNGRYGVSNPQPHDCLLRRLFRRWSKKSLKLPVTGLCAGNSPVTGEFPAQMASNAENVPMWWRHHDDGNSSWYKQSAQCSKRVCIGIFVMAVCLRCLCYHIMSVASYRSCKSWGFVSITTVRSMVCACLQVHGYTIAWRPYSFSHYYPDSKVHGANMGPTWVLSAPDGPHVGPMDLTIRVYFNIVI